MMKWLEWYSENGLLITWLIYSIGVMTTLIARYSIVAYCFYFISAIFGLVYVMLLVRKKIRDLRNKEMKEVKK